ncbi:unnamed protein product, partial [marine sediment metagenome]
MVLVISAAPGILEGIGRGCGVKRGGEAMTTIAASALDGHVLVLNKYYAPIHVTSVRRAFGMLYGKLAEVI